VSLCQWWTTLSYHIAQRVQDYVAAQDASAPPSSIAVVLTSGNGGGIIAVDLSVTLKEEEEDRLAQRQQAEGSAVSLAALAKRAVN
jgi:hypothetical protein